MGVLACDRSGCQNIMCDRLILNCRAYICWSCWNELLEYKKTWPTTMPVGEVKSRIESFMDTDPGSKIPLNNEEIDKEFAELTDGPHNDDDWCK